MIFDGGVDQRSMILTSVKLHIFDPLRRCADDSSVSLRLTASLMQGSLCRLQILRQMEIIMTKTVTVYTDGACSGNPGPGGWGAILCYKGREKELSGGAAQTTNNRMELTGVISALEQLKEPCVVELYSDSKYVVDALEKGWARSWRRNGWKKADKKPALNSDLWERLLELCDRHTVRCHWVKGHAENEYNNRCDALAVSRRDEFAR